MDASTEAGACRDAERGQREYGEEEDHGEREAIDGYGTGVLAAIRTTDILVFALEHRD